MAPAAGASPSGCRVAGAPRQSGREGQGKGAGRAGNRHLGQSSHPPVTPPQKHRKNQEVDARPGEAAGLRVSAPKPWRGSQATRGPHVPQTHPPRRTRPRSESLKITKSSTDGSPTAQVRYLPSRTHAARGPHEDAETAGGSQTGSADARGWEGGAAAAPLGSRGLGPGRLSGRPPQPRGSSVPCGPSTPLPEPTKPGFPSGVLAPSGFQ